MFTWICPKCGREVGPSHSECPFCAEAAQKAQATVTQAMPQAAPPPQYQPPVPPQVQYPPQPQYVPPPPPYVPPQAPPPPAPMAVLPPPPPQQVYYIGADDNKRKLPGWAAALLAFVAVGAVAGGVVYFTGNRSSSRAPIEKKTTTGGTYAKFLEITGFRITEVGKKTKVQFLAVNHGAADLSGVEGIITLQIKGDPNAEPAATFKFAIENIPAFGAKEIEVSTFTQKRKFFDMPDWQFINPVVEFTSSE